MIWGERSPLNPGDQRETATQHECGSLSRSHARRAIRQLRVSRRGAREAVRERWALVPTRSCQSCGACVCRSRRDAPQRCARVLAKTRRIHRAARGTGASGRRRRSNQAAFRTASAWVSSITIGCSWPARPATLMTSYRPGDMRLYRALPSDAPSLAEMERAPAKGQGCWRPPQPPVMHAGRARPLRRHHCPTGIGPRRSPRFRSRSPSSCRPRSRRSLMRA